jgi:hypothetical protein
MPSRSKAGFDKNPGNINRKGRPKKANTMTQILNDVIGEESVNFNGKNISGKEAAARKIFALAMQGDLAALKYIYDRIDGTPTQSVKQVDDEGKSIDPKFVIAFKDPDQESGN